LDFFFVQVFRKHIRQLLLHDFPEHYGEVLNLVLRGSETQNLSLEVWFDVLNALMSGEGENLAPPRRLKSGQNLGRVKEEARNYATEQKMLTYQEVRHSSFTKLQVLSHVSLLNVFRMFFFILYGSVFYSGVNESTIKGRIMRTEP
jgi:hypothetical protein